MRRTKSASVRLTGEVTIRDQFKKIDSPSFIPLSEGVWLIKDEELIAMAYRDTLIQLCAKVFKERGGGFLCSLMEWWSSRRALINTKKLWDSIEEKSGITFFNEHFKMTGSGKTVLLRHMGPYS